MNFMTSLPKLSSELTGHFPLAGILCKGVEGH